MFKTENNFLLPRVCIVIAVLSGLLVMPYTGGMAQEVSVDVEVSSKKVGLGSAIQLTVTVYGDNTIDLVPLPDIEGFDVKYMGPSTRVSVVNGQYSSSKSFIYSLYPQKVGQFQIPSSKVTIRGRTFTLPNIPLEVVASIDPSSRAGVDGQPTSLSDRLFIELKLPKQEVYLNEALPVKILMFVSGLSARDIQYPDLNTIGFSMGDFDQPKQYQQVINGLRYDIVEFNTKIYPTRTGELQLGPAKITCNVLVQTQGSQLGGGSVFDDDFFNSFFNRQQKRPITLESKQETVRVLPLPDEGKPQDFSGAVGQFDFNVSVSPTDVKEGDPLTLRTTIIGKGNFSMIQMPTVPSDSDFKLYDPQIYEEDNVKKCEQVVIPRSSAISEVPAIQFSYFDPELKKYRTIRKGPFPIKVTKLENGEDFKVVGLEGEYRPVEPEKIGEDIVFIKIKPGKFSVKGRFLYNSMTFYMIAFLAAIAWLGAFMHYRRTHRMKTDIVYARRLLAPRKAKKGLVAAKLMIDEGRDKEFYDALFKTTQEYLGNKLHLTSGAVTAETVKSSLKGRNIEPTVIDDIVGIFDECDMVRYASAAIDKDRMRESFERLTRSIDFLERHLK